MAFPQSTVKLLEGFENTSDPRHRRGLLAELKIIKLYLEKGFTLKSHRKEYFKTEVDIVMESSSKIILIEVKETTHTDYIFYRMSAAQKKRLRNVFLRFIAITPKEVEFHYIVTSGDEVHVFDDFLA